MNQFHYPTLHAVLLAGSLLSSNLDAQHNRPHWLPPSVSSEGSTPSLDFSKNPVLKGLTPHSRPIWAVSCHKMPSDPVGQWTVCFTVRALQGFGNPGFSGFLMATWSPTSSTPLVLQHYADGVNEAFIDYNLNLEPVTRGVNGARTGGRYAVFDRFHFVSGQWTHFGVYLATRKDDKSNFGKGTKVAKLTGTQNWADPALGYVDGKLKLFYGALGKDGSGKMVQGIFMDDLLNVATAPAVAGNPVLVAGPNDRGNQAAWMPHSPVPVIGADGDVEGMFVAEGDAQGVVSEIFFAADLDPTTPHAKTVASTDWLYAGGLAGGTALFAESGKADSALHIEGTWLVGDVVSPGGTAEATMSAYSAPGKGLAYTVVFSSLRWLPRPVALPQTLGLLGIAPMAQLGCGLIPDADQTVSYGFKVPNLQSLRGVEFPIQGLSVHQAADNSTVTSLTNTARIRIR